ncbi:Transferase [Macleaya cordata]|uniref:Transferase n=1 Tax=Macleaya cordata TaxID=56857 RepID=A0A200QZE3_MACCD|nr:Transferase [Macleaya cordata]
MNCEDVRYVSTSTVRPTSHGVAIQQRIDLTTWDLFFLPHQYMQRGLLFKKPCGQSKLVETNIISHLKTSLSRTLDHFFPLAGRLATTKHDDGTISVYIDCNSAGAEFIHAAADITIADILDPTYVPHIVRSFFPLNGVINYDGRSQPLLSAQVTELIDGIFISCSVNHVICDGISFSHFFNSWSEISRGLDHISRPPIIERWFLENTDCPIRLPSSTNEFLSEAHTPPQFEERVFHFTQENIARLKAKANSESETDRNISSLQALLAHIWVAFMRARHSDPNKETSYWLAIGNRARLNPPLPEAYFGNSVQPRFVSTTAGELLERGLGWGASLLNQMVVSHDEVAIKSYWETWMEKPVLASPYTTLVSGGSPRFDMYCNDFGWGQPIGVRSGISNKLDGKITAIPGRVKGSVDIEACFSLETLNAMGDDAEFMEVVTVLLPFQNDVI